MNCRGNLVGVISELRHAMEHQVIDSEPELDTETVGTISVNFYNLR